MSFLRIVLFLVFALVFVFAYCLSFSTNAWGNISSETMPQVLYTNLQIPWEIQFLPKPNEKTMLYTERQGFLNIIQAGGQLGARRDRFKIASVSHVGEGGLLGLAIHPQFNRNKWIYIYRTVIKKEKYYNQVVRYRYQNSNLSDETVIVDDIPGNVIHNGGRLAFGPDNYLYITTGDAADPKSAQDKNSLAGKILRVDENGKPAPSNPFNNVVYTVGHRNPQGLAWDNKGKLYATEHGPIGYDKLNLIERGKNYGWPLVQDLKYPEEFTAPLLSSGADETWAPAGLAYWNGNLYFGGLRGEALYEVNLSELAKSELQLQPIQPTKLFYQKFGRIRAVTVGPDNFLYLSTSNRDGRATQLQAEDDRILFLKH